MNPLTPMLWSRVSREPMVLRSQIVLWNSKTQFYTPHSLSLTNLDLQRLPKMLPLWSWKPLNRFPIAIDTP